MFVIPSAILSANQSNYIKWHETVNYVNWYHVEEAIFAEWDPRDEVHIHMDDNSCKVELLQGMLAQEEDNDTCRRRANPVVSFCKLHTCNSFYCGKIVPL